MRITNQTFSHVAQTVRHHLGNAYNTARHYARKIDQTVQTAQKVYAHVAPIIKDVAPRFEQKASKRVAKVKESYDSLKGDVVDVHGQAKHHAKKLNDVGAMLGL